MAVPLIHTAEVRWFIDGGSPSEAVDWFERHFGSTPVESRTDRYLVLPSRGAVGIKLRAHVGLEVKVRTDGPESVHLPAGARGHVERWAKWTCHEAAVTAALTASSGADGRWVEVRKQRRLCRLAIDGDRARPAEWGEVAAGGGHVEFTIVEAADRRTGTLGFESWGAPERIRNLLDTLVTAVLGTEPSVPYRLSLDQSVSYPGWLESIVPEVP